MDPERSYLAEPFEENMMENLVITLFGIAVVVFLLGFVWKCCGDNTEENQTQNKIQMSPVYVHELEPGIVVVQSLDGEYFRILQEYQAVRQNSLSTGASASGGYESASLHCAGVQKNNQFLPVFTRPHYQNAPTAPPIPAENVYDINFGACPPPPYSRK